VIDLQEWLTQRAEEKKLLYEQYGKPIEQDHNGEYLAIGPDGQTILGKRSGELLRKAVETFGSGNFGIFRVGHDAYADWLTL
jgi:hypothetical protein